MVTRYRVSNQRQKRPSAHDGRVVCCQDLMTPPSCLASMNELKLYTFLLELVSSPFPAVANARQQEGIYTFECAYAVSGTATCRFRWFSPDETDVFYLQGSTAIQLGVIGYSASIQNCVTGAWSSAGGYNFPSSGISFETFLCSETPILFTEGSDIRRITPIAP